MPRTLFGTYAAPVSASLRIEKTDDQAATRRAIWTRLDRVAAVAYSVVAVPLILNEAASVQGGAVAFAGLALVGSAIAVRRSRPVPSVALCLAGLGLLAVAMPRASVVGFGGLVAVVYTVAASATVRVAATALVVVAAAAAATALPRAEHLGAAGAYGTALTISWALGF